MCHLVNGHEGTDMCVLAGDDLTTYVEKLGWTLDASTGVVSIPPNPDNQIESTVVQENIQLPRASRFPACLM